MSARPYVLERGRVARTFPTIGALAGALLDLRARAPGRPALKIARAQLSRMEIPGAHVFSVRLDDGFCGGLGTPCGYIFLPHYGRDATRLRALLGAARLRVAA